MSHLVQVYPGYYMLTIGRAVTVRDVPPHFKISDQVRTDLSVWPW